MNTLFNLLQDTDYLENAQYNMLWARTMLLRRVLMEHIKWSCWSTPLTSRIFGEWIWLILKKSKITTSLYDPDEEIKLFSL